MPDPDEIAAAWAVASDRERTLLGDMLEAVSPDHMAQSFVEFSTGIEEIVRELEGCKSKFVEVFRGEGSIKTRYERLSRAAQTASDEDLKHIQRAVRRAIDLSDDVATRALAWGAAQKHLSVYLIGVADARELMRTGRLPSRRPKGGESGE